MDLRTFEIRLRSHALAAGCVVAACGGVVAVPNKAGDGGGAANGAGGGTGAPGNASGGKGATTASAGAAPVMLLPDGGCPDPSAPIYDGVYICLDRATATDICERRASARSPGESNRAVSCGAGCLCTYCAAEWFQCDTDPDCMAIMLCAAAHDCTGVACYTPDTCQAVFDRSDNNMGITSLATALSQVLMNCATKTTLGDMNYADRPGPVCPLGCPSTK